MANLEVLALDEATPQIRAPGSGDGYTMPRPLEIGIGTITTDIKVLDLSVTWNNAAVTFAGAKINVTNTASAYFSSLLDLQNGGVSQYRFNKLSTGGGVGVPAFALGTDAGFRRSAASFLRVITTGNDEFCFNGYILRAATTGAFAWDDNGQAGNGTVVLSLYKDANDTLAQRRSTNAQTLRLYRTFTDASNYQRLTETWSTSTAVIHNEGAGTGADGSIAFNDAALATDATKGFIMIPSCAGTPTGTPADIPTGQVPIVFDSTNNKLYVYDGGWLATAALT